ncbi:hypothetical protein Droror1_Dr00027901 [Drosera rotundifolia]
MAKVPNSLILGRVIGDVIDCFTPTSEIVDCVDHMRAADGETVLVVGKPVYYFAVEGFTGGEIQYGGFGRGRRRRQEGERGMRRVESWAAAEEKTERICARREVGSEEKTSRGSNWESDGSSRRKGERRRLGFVGSGWAAMREKRWLRETWFHLSKKRKEGGGN